MIKILSNILFTEQTIYVVIEQAHAILTKNNYDNNDILITAFQMSLCLNIIKRFISVLKTS